MSLGKKSSQKTVNAEQGASHLIWREASRRSEANLEDSVCPGLYRFQKFARTLIRSGNRVSRLMDFSTSLAIFWIRACKNLQSQGWIQASGIGSAFLFVLRPTTAMGPPIPKHKSPTNPRPTPPIRRCGPEPPGPQAPGAPRFSGPQSRVPSPHPGSPLEKLETQQSFPMKSCLG